jgi:predicted lysophospholipase L1 biosynthesis ABC-type transport system permease subunit
VSDRLTEENGERTWRLYRISWYVTVALAVLNLFIALFFFSRMWHGYTDAYAAVSAIMMGFVVIACVLLMGAGMSRFQARLEGQHVELKLALNRLADQLDHVQAEVTGLAVPRLEQTPDDQ